MSDIHTTLQELVRHYRRRVLRRAALMTGVGLACVAVWGWRLWVLQFHHTWIIGVASCLALALVVWQAWYLQRQYISEKALAFELDQRFGGAARFLTAAEFEKVPNPPALYPDLLEDATRIVEKIQQRVPRVVDRRAVILGVVLVLALVWPSRHVIRLASAILPAAIIPGQTPPTPPPETPPPTTGQSENSSGGQSPQSCPCGGDSSQQDQQSSSQSGGSASQSPSSSGQQGQSKSSQGQGQQQQQSGAQSDGSNSASSKSEASTGQQSQGQQSQQPQGQSQKSGASQSGQTQQAQSGSSSAQQQGQNQQGQSAGAQTAQQQGSGGSKTAQGQKSQQAQSESGDSSGGGGNREALQQDIQQLLKELTSELKNMQAEMGQQSGQTAPNMGTGTDPNLYGDSEQLDRATGAQMPIQLDVDQQQGGSGKNRKGSGIGQPSGKVSSMGPQTALEEVTVGDQSQEEQAVSRQPIPPEYQPVFEHMSQSNNP